MINQSSAATVNISLFDGACQHSSIDASKQLEQNKRRRFVSVFEHPILQDKTPAFSGSIGQITDQVLQRAEIISEISQQKLKYKNEIEKAPETSVKEVIEANVSGINQLYGQLAQECLEKDEIEEFAEKVHDSTTDEGASQGISICQATAMLNQLLQMKMQQQEQKLVEKATDAGAAGSSKGADERKKQHQYDLFRQVFN